jgi:crotonobetainyl-CoA:carnitine CoA-transferase CaiB-like acyl-CoA transferase
MKIDILKNIKVLDLSRIFTGPYCTQILGDLGAEIIKIEPPGGDDTRMWGPPFIADDMSTYYIALNRNKKSFILNLKDPKDKEKFDKIVKSVDIIVENFRPGVTKRLNVDYEYCKILNPSLIYLSITGFGSSGPYKDNTAYDIIAQGESGLMSTTGTVDEFTKVGVPVADISAGMYGVIGILSALYNRELTGKGNYIETSLFGSLTSWLTYQAMNSYLSKRNIEPMGSAHPNIVPYQVFETKDGKSICIAIGNDRLWQQFLISIGRDDLLSDYRFTSNKNRVKNRDELITIIKNIFQEKDLIHWENLLNKIKVPFGRIVGTYDIFTHPQVIAQKMTFDLDYQEFETKLPVFKTPLDFIDGIVKHSSLPPKLGENQKELDSLLK